MDWVPRQAQRSTPDASSWVTLHGRGPSCPAHLRVFSIVPNLYTLDAGSHNTQAPHPTPRCDNQNVSRHGSMSPGRQNHSPTALKEASLSTLLCLTYSK